MIPRSEYPRPDFKRNNWMSLNGTWQFEFDKENTGLKEHWYSAAHAFGKTIQVPFCYQAKASGIGLEELIDVVWYRRAFTVPESFSGKRVFLRFGAVDYEAGVYINGKYIGSHQGGYSPFFFDITDDVIEGENDLCIRVEDQADCQQPRGKQYWKEGWKRCWYVPCTGIWQSVYLEAMEPLYLENILVTPDIDKGEAKVQLRLNKVPDQDTDALIEMSYQGNIEKVVSVKIDGKNTAVTVNMVDRHGIEDIHLWSPMDPSLYDLKVTLVSDGVKGDEVTTYFGMRKVEVHNGYITLNNRAIYLRMVLDQGYWPDSLITAPTEDALKADIEWTLKLGYNGARKHQKFEDPLYYYWADRMGLLVWGEVPSAFEFTSKALRNTAETLSDFIDRDYNHPSVIAWVPVNESWGMTRIFNNPQMQSAARMLYHECKALDPTRMVSTNDGWETVETDILGLHDYSADRESLAFHFGDDDRINNYTLSSRMGCANGFVPTGKEALMVTEYGGIAIDNTGTGWGYNGKVKNEDEFFARFAGAMEGIHSIKRCRGYCYTQLTDVRQEQNGLLYPDRTPKVDPERFRELNVNPHGEK